MKLFSVPSASAIADSVASRSSGMLASPLRKAATAYAAGLIRGRLRQVPPAPCPAKAPVVRRAPATVQVQRRSVPRGPGPTAGRAFRRTPRYSGEGGTEELGGFLGGLLASRGATCHFRRCFDHLVHRAHDLVGIGSQESFQRGAEWDRHI